MVAALLAGGAAAYYSPLVYTYMMTSPDTIANKDTTIASGDSVTVALIRKVAGTAGAMGVDSLGVGDYAFVMSKTGSLISLFVNGLTTSKTLVNRAGEVRVIETRWIDSIRVKVVGGADSVFIEIDGHKQWFSNGGVY